MREYKQAKWLEPSLFELGCQGREGVIWGSSETEGMPLVNVESLIPGDLLRKEEPENPELSEVEVVRHFLRLSQMNYCVDSGFYPLGSCTMKYNPKVNEVVSSSEKVLWLHPYQDESTIQGALELMYKLSIWLAEITGAHTVSLQPAAGAHGELVGCLIMRKYNKVNGKLGTKNEIIVPDSAHGTNFASAAAAGFKVVVTPTNPDGCVDIEALKSAASEKTVGLMLTNPNTLGIFERDILEIAKIVHEVDGLLYYDGANLNGVMGISRPGDMGFDIVHVNLHKTFSTPHGGGGPGSGPVGVKKELVDYLPVPIVGCDGKKYFLDYNLPHTIGKSKGFFGNFGVLVRTFVYLLIMGGGGLKKASEICCLNANYVAKEVSKLNGFTLPYSPSIPRKHECVISGFKLKAETGVSTKIMAKNILDRGIHSPTVYFPPIVDEALMIEPTETEPLEELDRFIETLANISSQAYSDPKTLLNAPFNTSVALLDEVKASHPRTMALSWRMFKKQ